MKQALSRILPWLVTIFLLAFVAHTTNIPEVVTASRKVHLPRFALTLTGMFLFLWTYDCWCTVVALGRYAVRIPYREVLTYRGAAWVLSAVNGTAGDALFAFYVQQNTAASFVQIVSVLLMLAFLDAYVLMGIATIGAAYAVPALTSTFLMIYGGMLAFFAAHLLYWRKGMNFGLPRSLRSWDILGVFQQATISDYLVGFALRTPLFILDALSTAVLLGCFDLSVPLVGMMAVKPVLTIITFLPVTVAGFGSVHIAARELFGAVHITNTAVIDAFSTLYLTSWIVIRLTVGAACYLISMRLKANERFV